MLMAAGIRTVPAAHHMALSRLTLRHSGQSSRPAGHTRSSRSTWKHPSQSGPAGHTLSGDSFVSYLLDGEVMGLPSPEAALQDHHALSGLAALSVEVCELVALVFPC